MPTINPALPANGDDAIVDPYNAAIELILSVINGSIDANNIAAGAVGLSELSATVQGALVPSGALFAYGGGSAPTGFLMCDGSSQLRASFSALFAVIGTSYGTADGTHFNLPDLRGRVPVGADAMSGTAANRIQRTSTLTTVSGSASATVGSATGLSIGMIIKNVNVPAGTTITVISGTTLTMSANATANGTTVAATFSLIGNDATALGSVGGTDIQALVIDQMPSHTHTAVTFTVASGGGTTLAASAGTIVDGAAVGINNTGGSQNHPNMQPSVITNYIIKT